MEQLEKVKHLLIELEIDEIADAVQEALKTHKPVEIINVISEGMLEVGRLYEEQEYYLPELVLGGETVEEAMKILNPLLEAGEGVPKKATVVAATVKGDHHDIGKNIVCVMLRAAGYDVKDLGKDVHESKIIEAVEKYKPEIVALSALLTMTVVEIETVVNELKAKGLRDSVKVMCGGAPLNEELAKKLGADYYSDDAVNAIEVANKIVAGEL